MIDLFNIPNSQQDVQIFYANGSTWQTWSKPRKCNYVWIMCIGGGSGGQGGGNNAPEGVGAGVGGGSGAITKVLYNSQLLPDRLYIQVGLGGIGTTDPLFPSSGTRSIVSLQPTVVAQNLVAISGNVAANTPNGETVSTQATATFYTLGNFISINGQSNNGTSDVIPLSSTVVSAGASGASGGGFDSGIGWSIIASQLTPRINGGGYAIDGANGGNGDNGITSFKPFFSTGGAGGGSSDSSTSGNGGNGGKGGIGSGGGSGGSANVDLGGTIGKGGDGGDGLVMIISF
jgi:hypothetical protein